jgi:uncharacterized protein (TIGR02118 family)
MIKVTALLKRKPGISKEEFADRWLAKHAKLAAKMPGLRGYRINIAVAHQPDGDNIEPIYDGTAELWWDSVQDMETAFASEIGVMAGKDADEFAGVRIHVYTEENIIVKGPEKRVTARRPAAKRKTAARKIKRTR